MIDKLLEKQKELQNRLISDRNLKNMTDNKEYWLKQMTLSLFSEVNELMNELNWKHWKNEKELDYEAIKYEAIDILHFLLTVFIVLDMTEKEIVDYYMNKNKENHERQEGKIKGREDYEINREG